VVVDASHAPEPTPVKSLAERVAYANPKSKKSEPLTKTSANPKAQPKSATAKKNDPKDKNKAGKAKPARKAKNARPKPKTAEELDAEMTDYWAGGAGAAAGGTEGAAANGATAAAGDAMEEISVSLPWLCPRRTTLMSISEWRHGIILIRLHLYQQNYDNFFDDSTSILLRIAWMLE